MTMFMSWLAWTFGATTFLMLAVLALRDVVRSRLGAGAAYALWLLPALRMALPPIQLPSSAEIPSMWPSLPTIYGHLQGQAAGPGVDGPAAAPLSTVGLIFSLWLSGAAVHLAIQIWRYRSFLSGRMKNATLSGVVEGIVIHLADVEGPVAGGLTRRFILLPLDFQRRYTPVQQRLVIAHELTHHRRRDVTVNAAAAALFSLHWFNPVAYIAARAFRTDQELACDAAVVALSPASERRAYAEALVTTALGGADPIACGLGGAPALKRRLRSIAGLRRTSAARSRAAVASLTLIGLALTAMTTRAPAEAAMDANRRLEPLHAALRLVPGGGTGSTGHDPSEAAAQLHFQPGRNAPSPAPAPLSDPRETASNEARPARLGDLSDTCRAELAAGDRGEAAPGPECERQRILHINLALLRQRGFVPPDPVGTNGAAHGMSGP